MRKFLPALLLTTTLWAQTSTARLTVGGTMAMGSGVQPSGNVPAFVQSTTNCSFGGTNNSTATVGGSSATTCPTATGWASNVTAGNTLAGFVWRKTGSATLNSVSDSSGDTCTGVNTAGTTGTSALYVVYGFYCSNITGGVKPTVTLTFSNTEDTWYVLVHEVSGILASSPLDGSVFVGQAAVGGGTNAGTTGSWTTSTNGDYIIGGFLDDAQNGRTISAGTTSQAWTNRVPLDNTHVESMISEDGVQAAASGSTVIAFTTSALTNPLMGAMAFKHS